MDSEFGTVIPFDENVSNLRFVAFDTETTGSSTNTDHVIEIGAISFDEEFEHRRFETFVKPPGAISPDVTKIHGITDEMVASAPGQLKALERFFEFLRFAGAPRVLLAHNAGFDVGMIHGAAKYAMGATEGVPSKDSYDASSVAEAEPELVLDTCMLAKTLLPELERHSLEALMTHFKLEPVRYHRALEDTKALYAVFMRLLGLAADQCAQGTGLTLNHLIDLAGGYFVLDVNDAKVRKKPFRLPPRIAAIEPLCGSEARIAIVYSESAMHRESEERDYRYITPQAVKMRAFKVYIEAFCHRDNIKKTFRADKILRIGKIEK